jgi:hypothetical protein
LSNVGLEPLIKDRYDLPAFSTVDRLGQRVRTLVNQRFFVTAFHQLSTVERARLDALLTADPRLPRSVYNRLKQVPKRPTLTPLQEGLTHLAWLLSLDAPESPIRGLPSIKRKHFALEAKA